MPWISNTRLRELEDAARPKERGSAVLAHGGHIPASSWPKPDPSPTVQQVMDAFRTLWPKHAAALRAMSKKRNPFADLLGMPSRFVFSATTVWDEEDVKTLLALAKARRDVSKADGLRADVAALRAGVAVENPLRPKKDEE